MASFPWFYEVFPTILVNWIACHGFGVFNLNRGLNSKFMEISYIKEQLRICLWKVSVLLESEFFGPRQSNFRWSKISRLVDMLALSWSPSSRLGNSNETKTLSILLENFTHIVLQLNSLNNVKQYGYGSKHLYPSDLVNIQKTFDSSADTVDAKSYPKNYPIFS